MELLLLSCVIIVLFLATLLILKIRSTFYLKELICPLCNETIMNSNQLICKTCKDKKRPWQK